MKAFFLAFIFSAIALSGFAQAFDDMPFPNPSNMTYFQQEMTSLMRFQAKNNINIPFFASASWENAFLEYQTDYLKSLYSDYPDFYNEIITSENLASAKGTIDTNILLGAQIKINNQFYIPLFFSMGGYGYSRNLEEFVYVYEGVEYKTPAVLMGAGFDVFWGSGVFVNTDIIKGGIYLGWLTWNSDKEQITLPNPYHDRNEVHMGAFVIDRSGFKIALAPLVNTSGWKYVGKVLDNILGYLGTGDAVIYANDEGDSKITALVYSLNSALDFTFNRINFAPLALTAQTIYTRGNYDAAAKTDTFGVKINGALSDFPFGFTLEGGYKHFYYVAKYFEEDYTDTGYFNGSIYFPLKHITLGLIYKYDSINNSTVTFALSTNFLSGFFGLIFFDKNKYDKDKYYNNGLNGSAGIRFRWGGWKVKPQEEEKPESLL